MQNNMKDSASCTLMTRDMALCGLFAALIAAGAFIKISIPVQPVPMHFTLQWFFVLLAGLLLGPRMGALSVCTYVVIGLVGVPVFASGGGPAYLLKPTFGYLLGFIAAAWAAGALSSRVRPAGMAGHLVPAFAGLFIYYAVGAVYFYLAVNFVYRVQVGWQLWLVNCVLLTIAGDMVLCFLAAAMAARVRRFL